MYWTKYVPGWSTDLYYYGVCCYHLQNKTFSFINDYKACPGYFSLFAFSLHRWLQSKFIWIHNLCLNRFTIIFIFFVDFFLCWVSIVSAKTQRLFFCLKKNRVFHPTESSRVLLKPSAFHPSLFLLKHNFFCFYLIKKHFLIQVFWNNCVTSTPVILSNNFNSN